MNRLLEYIIRAAMICFMVATVCFSGTVDAAESGMIKIGPGERPVFEDDLDLEKLVDAVSASIAYYRKLPPHRTFAFGRDNYTASQLADGLTRLSLFLRTDPSRETLEAFMDKYASVYGRVDQAKPLDVLFTGYFEPLLSGSREKSSTFVYPVYERPDNLVSIDLTAFSAGCVEKTVVGRHAGKKVVPYYDRRTIENTDVMSGHAEPIAWVADPVGLFFLHVQGSGRIRLEDDTVINVQYDGTNGLPYESIGQYLIDNDKVSVTDMSMQAIRAYVENNPEEMDAIFQSNPRYVFFRERSHGTIGCLGTELTGKRSVALDQSINPAGALLYIQAEKPVCNPDGSIEKWVEFSRFALNQDTGTAIRGPARADIYWGSGAYAETAAGYMKHRGQIYFIVIKP